MRARRMRPRRLMAVLAHPDDESFGFGGVLAQSAAAGVEVFVVTATRGDAGRYRGLRADDPQHPGKTALAAIREAELRKACALLGVREVVVLDYKDGQLDRANPAEVIAELAQQMTRVQPDVVVTFGPDGAYGHPDHIAISQFTTAAVVAAAAMSNAVSHAVSKLYYLAWSASTWAEYESATQPMVSIVDGVERRANPWPDWAITTVVDTHEFAGKVWEAIACHDSQVEGYGNLKNVAPEHHEALWGRQSFYRVFSTVNGGRQTETDLFGGIE